MILIFFNNLSYDVYCNYLLSKYKIKDLDVILKHIYNTNKFDNHNTFLIFKNDYVLLQQLPIYNEVIIFDNKLIYDVYIWSREGFTFNNKQYSSIKDSKYRIYGNENNYQEPIITNKQIKEIIYKD